MAKDLYFFFGELSKSNGEFAMTIIDKSDFASLFWVKICLSEESVLKANSGTFIQ